METKAKISTEEELSVLLGSLGSTSTEVAAALVKAGIKGKRHEAECCPVANWLRAETGYEPAVDGCEVSLLAPHGSPELMVVPPEPVREFVIDFDQRRYPDLEEKAGA